MTACTAIPTWLEVKPGNECGNSPAVMTRRACVHEHVREGYLCDLHINAVADGFCRDCYYLPEGAHECRIVLEMVPS